MNVEPTRYGEVLRVVEPITVSYSHPWQCVLFNNARDANPFFHLFEALWMLAGKQSISWLKKFAGIVPSFSDDGKTWHGAYGWRWRMLHGIDQLNAVIQMLRIRPYSRRAVLAMWDVSADLKRLITMPECKDVPCNTHVYVEVEDEKFVNITVCNRSNDLVWGMLGSNAVHFPILQQYIADCLSLEPGTYHHFTNNLHAYTTKPDGTPTDVWRPQAFLKEPMVEERYYEPDQLSGTMPPRFKLVEDKDRFDQEVMYFTSCECYDMVADFCEDDGTGMGMFQEPFLRDVALPMLRAFIAHKQRDYRTAKLRCREIHAADWMMASTLWIDRRQQRWLMKHNTQQQLAEQQGVTYNSDAPANSGD